MNARFYAPVALLFMLPPLRADVTNIVRPDFQNITASGTLQVKNPSVIFFQGHVKPAASAPSDGAVRLTEASIGQPFAPWIPNPGVTVDQAYAAEVAAEVRTALYPPANANRTAVENGGTAFRYKWLLFSPNPGESDVTNHFENIADWFNNTDRATVNTQIEKLRDALAHAPLDTGLRHLLLDCYYDLAVAEMQTAKKKLAELSAKRLGLQLVSPFIIDDEIATYEQLVTQVDAVLAKYAELLSYKADGVEPADFDDRVARGMPMGYYVFVREQPHRNSTPSQYASDPFTLTGGTTISGSPNITVSSTAKLVIGMPITGPGIPADTVVKSVLGPATFTISKNATAGGTGLTFTFPGGSVTVPDFDGAAGSVVPRPVNEVLFSGYKDYTACLRIMGDYVRYQAELARLRGMRQGPGDVSKGRAALSRIMKETMLDFVLLRGMYPANQLPSSDASGVHAAINSVETAVADIVNVRSFLNGTANVLGLDRNFLLLVQESTIGGTRYFDSFDILRQRLKGENQPLRVALDRKAEAEIRYNNFRSSVDRVARELDDLDENFADRFFEITGYTPDENPGFNGIAKQRSGSELDLVEQTIASLGHRSGILGDLKKHLDDDLVLANNSVKDAEGLSAAVEEARDTYYNQTSSAWNEIHRWSAGAAASQAVADGVYAFSGIDPGNAIFSGGTTAFAVVAAAATNTGVQTAAARNISMRQQDIDRAAIGYEATQEKNDAALTVNQARQEAGAVKREQYANKLETEDNTAALGQAMAQRTALLNEVQRITASRSSNTVAVRSKFYADPIHYLRAENALIDADEAFRDAQRWLFYTLKALEYKWQQRFSRSQGGKSWDTGTIFKLRNAQELDDLLTQMVSWNDSRQAEDISGEDTTFISLKDHVLAPNPGNLRVTNTGDSGSRVDFLTNQTVTQQELFRRKVLRLRDSDGIISIPFDTVLLADLNGNFFRSPDYFPNGTVIPGKWRDKIVYVRVNLIASDASVIPSTRNGGLIYGGNTFTRTRIPPCGNRLTPINPPASAEATDFPAEFSVSPFRFYSSANYDDVFVSADFQSTSASLIYSNASARDANGQDRFQPASGDGPGKINAFNQRSVAATRWVLTINPNEIDVSKLRDIEIIIKHRFSDRVAPICP